MIRTIYSRVFSVLVKKPFRLWGLSLLGSFLALVGSVLFGAVPGLAIAIALLLSASMTLVFLRGYRGEEIQAVQLFDAFRDWGTIKRVLGGMGWMALWVFLWGLIPVVGIIFAIIRIYEYRLTPYILMTEPDVPPTQAIHLSKERTMGYKAKMFWADVLLWVFYFVAVLILSLLGLIPYVGGVFVLIHVLLTLCWCIFSGLFFGLMKAAFYEEITHPTIPLAAPQATYTPGSYTQEDPINYHTQPPVAPPTAQFCPSCGKRVKPDHVFCENCGAKLK